MKSVFHKLACLLLLVLIALPVVAQDSQPLTIYSGRNENLIGPILQQFTETTGIEVEVLYGDTNGVASQILEEGQNSPADVFIAQDAGALGALAKADLFTELPTEILELVENSAFVSPDGLWVGLSGRARVLVYNPEMLEESGLELPESILDLTDETWKGLIGWAPTNGSFRAHVTALRLELGDEETLAWLEGMVANETHSYEGNGAVVQAVIDGEILGGLVNHYYLYEFLAEDSEIIAQNYFFPDGDFGSLINVAGAGILATSDQTEDAQALLNFLLSEEAQTYFATTTYEYAVIDGIEPAEGLPALDEIETPEINLSDLDDLQGTIDLIEESGALDS